MVNVAMYLAHPVCHLQPEDGNTKDLIATLSEMSLNNGYLQEQVAIRDQYVQDLTKKYEYLEVTVLVLYNCCIVNSLK